MFIRSNKLIPIISLIVFLYSNFVSYSQPYERGLNNILISDSQGLLKNIFSAGHNNLEFQFVDIDGDGDLDIFYLDSDQTFGWFENVGDKFNADFKYSLTLPEGLYFSDWFYFVDIDADNDLDYFTGNVDVFSYYENMGSHTSPIFTLNQEIVKDFQDSTMNSEYGSNPTFADVEDAEGDFDFISGNSAGTLKFYKNIGTPQSYSFQFITNVWQNIIIIGGGADALHGASSIEFADMDDDSDLDLFWGDFFSKSIYVIENFGTSAVPDMQRVSDIYPVNADSVYTSGFNMPRFADIDADGDLDLFVSVLYDPTVPQSLMFLQNNGTPQSANHQLITNDYLKTLDVGNNSEPVFIDIDNDNDLDMFIGSLKNPLGSINFFENIGSNSNPEFLLVDSTFFGIRSDLSISPSFGDIDDDGDFDLMIGRFNGKLSLYLNSGTPTTPLFTNNVDVQNNNGEIIDVGSTAVPLLIDVDNDADLDLVIGGFNGKFNFYENTGNSSIYEFTSNNLYFDTLDIGDNSTPFLIDYDKNGTLDLFSGSRKGEFFYYRNDGTNSFPIWTLITDKFLTDNFGGNTIPSFVDIDNDTDIDILLGNVKGGLYFYENTKISGIDENGITPVDNFEISAFPNPFNPETNVRIELSVGQDIKIDVYNILGEKVNTILKGYIKAGNSTFNWNAKNNSGITLPAGIYFITVCSKETQKVIKVAFLK